MGNIVVASKIEKIMQYGKKNSNDSKTPWFVLNSPELGGPFQELSQACNHQGVLDRKTKQLLMLVAASAVDCPCRIEEHIESAMEAGASKEQITEALIIAAAEGATARLEMQKDVYLEHLRGNSKKE
jgi:AhpD family alkylhydroperoxidase